MSNQVEMMNATSTATSPWLLANLLSNCHKEDCCQGAALQSLLPGPFCVLQGSPGDGMANTLDSMPMLPIQSMKNHNTDEEAVENNNQCVDGGGRRRSLAMNNSLHPLEEMAEEEEEEQDNDISHRYRSNVDDDDDAKKKKNHSIGRDRSDSLTGGGLHYPLGEKSPIMQRRARSLSLNGTLMQQPSATSTVASLHRQHDNNDGRDLSSLRCLPFVHSSEGGQNDSSNTVHFHRPNTNKATTTTTTAERNAIRKWHQEVSQQEQSHLEERHQNVKLLLDRRKRSQERIVRQHEQQQQQHQQQLSNNAAQHDEHEQHGNNHRSGSPMALATATSASSSSSSNDDGDGSNSSYEGSNDDGSGSARSRPSSPPPPPVSTTAALITPQTITVTPPIIKKRQQQQEEKDPITRYMNSLELEISHRSWYQKDGRLVVFHSLPYKSLSSGKVVVHPLEFYEEEVEGTKKQHHHEEQGAEHWEQDDIVVTLAPGTTVMAEEAITLDSRSLKRIHSTTHDNDNDPQQQQQHRHEHNTDDYATLVFLRISSPYPGYILSHIHNYPYLAPGLPTTYTNSTWLWRVTCQPDGAFIRSGLDLITDHIGTLPYGTLCCVKKKVVNYMGLNRLEIDAFVNNGGDYDDNNCSDDANGKGSSVPTPTTKLSGYISEFLNPLSGQRGNIVEQVSFPVPALYKVIHAEGAIIRSGVELSTGQIGFAPMGSVLSIIGRSYSSNPSNNCIERLRLAGGGGWISVKLNRGDHGRLVEMIGVDESFDPEDPANFHFEQQKKVMAELKADDNGGAASPTNNGGGGSGGGVGGGVNIHLPRRRSTANLSEIAEDDQLSIPDSEGNLSTPPRQTSTTAAVPTLFQRSGVVGSLGGLVAMDAVRESSSDRHQNENANRCLICLSE